MCEWVSKKDGMFDGEFILVINDKSVINHQMFVYMTKYNLFV